MRLRALAAVVIASTAMLGAPGLARPAAAQTVATSTVLPTVLWAATGAVIGAVAWPIVVGGGAAATAAPGVMSLGAFLNVGAAAGAVLAGAGYFLTH